MPVVILSSIGLRDRDGAPLAAWLAKPIKPSALHDTIATILLGAESPGDQGRTLRLARRRLASGILCGSSSPRTTQ